MSKYRFKTKEEFEADGLWIDYNTVETPEGWEEYGGMNKYLGEEIPDQYIEQIDRGSDFYMDNWTFQAIDCIINWTEEEKEEQLKQILEQVKNNNSLITERKMKTTEKTTKRVANPVADKFVFMDKTVNILNVGYSTCKNVILYGPGE